MMRSNFGFSDSTSRAEKTSSNNIISLSSYKALHKEILDFYPPERFPPPSIIIVASFIKY